jgi:hypothetical protein
LPNPHGDKVGSITDIKDGCTIELDQIGQVPVEEDCQIAFALVSTSLAFPW